MNKCKLLAFDIDGTLCVPSQDIPEIVIESLSACLQSNILVIPATGKKYSSIERLCKRIGIEGPAITCNGAIVTNINTQEIIFSHYLSKSLYEKIVYELESDNRLSIAVFTDQDIVCTEENLASRLLDSIGEPTTRFVNSLFVLANERIAKVLIAVDNADTLKILHKYYSDKLRQNCSITITSNSFVEFMPPHVSKGNALLEISKMFGINNKNIVCIGDSNNDLSMFEISGSSIAVSNATPEVLEAADFVVPSASECGVANAIQTLILGEMSNNE